MDEEELIPVNFPPYEFRGEDESMASYIRGLKFSNVINPKPFGPTFYFEVNERNTFESKADFLRSVPAEFEIRYFRPFAPGKA